VLVRKGGKAMARRVGVEKAIRILREVEVLQGQGSTIGDACRKLGVAEHTYYRWKKEYGRLSLDQARRLKELETQNTRLKKLVADLSLDNAILREAASGNF
jgi:transposase-like protein